MAGQGAQNGPVPPEERGSAMEPGHRGKEKVYGSIR